jgi:hypothetical protein
MQWQNHSFSFIITKGAEFRHTKKWRGLPKQILRKKLFSSKRVYIFGRMMVPIT